MKRHTFLRYTIIQNNLVHKSLSSRVSQVIDLVALLLFVFPKGKVLLKKLDNALGITEIVFFKLVNLIKSILESLVGKLAGGFVVLHNFVVEN